MTRSIRLPLIAFGALLVSAGLANAQCQRVFSHTTCSGWGPMQKCVNHFKQQCTQARAAPKPVTSLANRNNAGNINQNKQPVINPKANASFGYGGIVAAGAGNAVNRQRLIGNDGSTFRR